MTDIDELARLQDDEAEALARGLGAEPSENSQDERSSLAEWNDDEPAAPSEDEQSELALWRAERQACLREREELHKATIASRAERILVRKELMIAEAKAEAAKPKRAPVKRARPFIKKPSWAAEDPETTATKKLKASLAGCLDRSICTTTQKRSALFDALNNHRKE